MYATAKRPWYRLHTITWLIVVLLVTTLQYCHLKGCEVKLNPIVRGYPKGWPLLELDRGRTDHWAVAATNITSYCLLVVGTVACCEARDWRRVTLPLAFVWTAIVGGILGMLRLEPISWTFYLKGAGEIVFSPTAHWYGPWVRTVVCVALACTIYSFGSLVLRIASYTQSRLRHPAPEKAEADGSPTR